MKRPKCMSYKRFLWRRAMSNCTCVLCRNLQSREQKERARRPTVLTKNNAPVGHVQGQLQETELMALQFLLKNKFLYLNFLSVQVGLITEFSSSYSIEPKIEFHWCWNPSASNLSPSGSPGFNCITLILSLTTLDVFTLFWTCSGAANDFRILTY